MDLLYQIITCLSDEEERALKKYIMRKSSDNNRKDIMLFNLLRSNEKYGTETILRKIYGSNGSKAYHQLRQTLKLQIEDFIFHNNGLKSDNNTYIQRMIIIARFLFNKKRAEAAWEYLQKAEKRALSGSEFTLLNIIYIEQLEYSIRINNVNVDSINSKRLENRELAKLYEDITTILWLIKYKIKLTLEKGEKSDAENIVMNLFDELNIAIDVAKQPVILYKLAMIVVVTLEENKEYISIEIFLLHIYHKLCTEGMLEKLNLSQRIELFSLISKYSLLNKKYEQCEKYLNMLRRLQEETKEETVPLWGAEMVAVNLYIRIGRLHHALDGLKKLELHKESINITDEFYIRTNLFSVYFLMKKYDEALKNLRFLQLKQDQKIFIEIFGKGAILFLEIAKCIILFEKKEHDLIDFRIKSITRKDKSLLKKPFYKREYQFLLILKEINRTSEVFMQKKTIKKINEFLASSANFTREEEYINLNAWLLSKVEKQNYYDIYLKITKPRFLKSFDI